MSGERKGEERRGEEGRVEKKKVEEGRGEVTAGKRRIRSRKKIIKNTKYGRKRGDLLKGGRSHVPLGKKRKKQGGKKKKSPRCQQDWGGGRGSGGPGCWQGCRNPGEWPVPHYPDTPPFTYTHRQKRPPHGPMTTLS